MEQAPAGSGSTPNSAPAAPKTVSGLADAIIARNTPEPKKREPAESSQSQPKPKAKPATPQADAGAGDDAQDDAADDADEPTGGERSGAESADGDTADGEAEGEGEQDTQADGEEQTDEQSDSETDGDESDADPEDEQQQDDPAARYTVKVGDKDTKVSLAALKSGYMMQQDYARKTQELSKHRKELVVHQQESVKIHESKLKEVGFLAQTLMHELISEDRNTNWEELRASDPTEFANRFASREQKREKLGKAYTAYQEHEKRAAQIEQHNRKIKLGEQAELLFTAIPEWLDRDAAKRGVSEIAGYLSKRGYAPDEARNIIDHRDLVSHYKAMMFDRQQQSVKSAKTKIKQAPTLVRKGGSLNTSQASNAAAQATKTFQKSGRPDDFAAVLLARSKRRANAR